MFLDPHERLLTRKKEKIDTISWGKSSFDACNLGKDVPIYDDHDADLAKESLDDADIVVTPLDGANLIGALKDLQQQLMR